MKKFWIILLVSALLCGCSIQMAPAETAGISSTVSQEGQNLYVHFIDVGQADCTLLKWGDNEILIDGGNVADGEAVISYLEQQGVEELELVICTHAHEDHVGGLQTVLSTYSVAAVWSPTTTYSSNCFDQFIYYADQQDLTVYIPSVGDTYKADGLTLTVLGPVKSYPDPNNTSLVTMVQYGDRRFLFTGDMEHDAEVDLIDSGADLSADVLKVGHHGSSTSTSYVFLRAVSPTYGVIHVGADNDYGHPHEEPMSRLEDAEVTLYRTDLLGSIVITCDGTGLEFSWGNTSAQPDEPVIGGDSNSESKYIGNINSKVLHLPTCSSLPAEKNQVIFTDYDEAISEGYSPCSRCMG